MHINEILSRTASLTEGQWQEAYIDRQVRIRVRNESGALVPPDYLYRVMSRTEYENAKKTGFFRPQPGERIHASEQPLPQHGSGIDSVTVRFDYDDADGWRAKWGDDLYAVTDQPISFNKATVIAERNNKPF